MDVELVQLDQLRDRAQRVLASQPADTTPEMGWLLGELSTIKDIIVALIDYLASRESPQTTTAASSTMTPPPDAAGLQPGEAPPPWAAASEPSGS